MLRGVEQQGRTGAEQRTRLRGDERAVSQFDGSGVYSAPLFALPGGNGAAAVVGGDACLLE